MPICSSSNSTYIARGWILTIQFFPFYIIIELIFYSIIELTFYIIIELTAIIEILLNWHVTFLY